MPDGPRRVPRRATAEATPERRAPNRECQCARELESRHPATVAVRRVPVVLSRVWRVDPLTQIDVQLHSSSGITVVNSVSLN